MRQAALILVPSQVGYARPVGLCPSTLKAQHVIKGDAGTQLAGALHGSPIQEHE